MPVCAAALPAQLVVLALVVLAAQMIIIRAMSAQRMASMGVLLTLPSTTVRNMATAPCQVRRACTCACRCCDRSPCCCSCHVLCCSHAHAAELGTFSQLCVLTNARR